jgi:hypothetical protein
MALRLHLICFLMLIAIIPASAQMFDSIVSSLQHKPTFELKFDSRNSFVTSRRVEIFGLKIGFDYNETVKLGIGYNDLSSAIINDRIVRYVWITDTVRSKLRLVYLSPYFEYVFHRSKKWEHTIPIQIGFGNAWYEYRDFEGVRIRENYKAVIFYEPSMTTQYRIIPSFAIGVGLGYRLLLINNRQFDENFNSPVYVFRTRIYFNELYKIVFPRHVKEN